MNIPFPKITPPLIDIAWFNSDSAVDEEAELAEMELAQKKDFNYVTRKYKKATPAKVRNAPEPMEEVESDEEEGNEESDESEESHDEEEEERTSYSPNQVPVEPATTTVTIPQPTDTNITDSAATESDGWT